MRRSKVEIYLHFVWATKQRLPLITSEVENALFGCIQQQVKHIGAETVALNGTKDHVHLLVSIPSTITVARLANQVKGVSSTFISDTFPSVGYFGWQENYAVFSVGRKQLERVTAYIENQKAHHADNSLYAAWEETDEASPSRAT